MSVTGPIPAADLGITTVHEHILFEGGWHHEPLTDPEQAAIGEVPLRIEHLGWARKYGYEHLDNGDRLDVDEAADELAWFGRQGGRTVVDQTSNGIGRDPAALREIARRTGLNIVMGGGWYVGRRHPADLAERTVEDLHAELEREICDGIGPGPEPERVRVGIIGEIGTSLLVTPGEEKVLRAAARTQATTGAPLSIHHEMFGRTGPAVLEIARQEGADLRRTMLCHCDLDARCEFEYFEAIAATGASIALDTFGHYDFYAFSRHPEWLPSPKRVWATDWDRAERIVALFEAGFGRQVLTAQDVCLKVQLKRYGGFGFDHLLESCVPLWGAAGLDEAGVRTVLVENPARVLAGVELVVPA
jgi:phosphotriesterase-related protein